MTRASRRPRFLRKSAALLLLVGLAVQVFKAVDAQTDPNASLLKMENTAVCAEAAKPPPERIPSCTWVLRQGLEKSDEAKILVARGQAFQQEGDEQAALKDYNAAVRDDRRSEAPWIARANLYESRSDYQLALGDYNRAISTAAGREDPAAYIGRGDALNGLGRRDDAIANFTRAIALDPHEVTAYSNRATVYLASNQMNLAIADLTAVIAAEPTNGMAYYDRGSAYERSSQLDKALDDYRSAARFSPSYAPAYAALGRLLKAKDPEAALATLSEAIRLDPKSPALRTRAILFLSLGRSEPALHDFDQVIANNGSDGIAYADRGVVKQNLEDFKGAIDDYTQSLALTSTVAVYVDRGNAYTHLHRDDEALADFNTALQREPHNLLALIGKADVDYRSKRFDASLQDYGRVIDADPRNAIAYFKRGNIHLDQRNWAAALRDYSQSLTINPNQPVVLYNRAIAEARLGRRNEAAKDQSRARALDPPMTTGR